MQANTVNYEPQKGYTPFADEEHPEPNGPPPEQQQLSQEPATKGKAHPLASFFHIFFKAAALLTYLLCGFFTNSFVLVFILITVMVAFDFWTVKNVTGRLMVGLRWWNDIKEDGTNEWVFESVEDKSQLSQSETMVFWISLFVAPAVWIIFFITGLLTLKFGWLLIVCVALALSIANIVGYLKCAKDAKKKIQNAASSFVFNQMLARATNAV